MLLRSEKGVQMRLNWISEQKRSLGITCNQPKMTPLNTNLFLSHYRIACGQVIVLFMHPAEWLEHKARNWQFEFSICMVFLACFSSKLLPLMPSLILTLPSNLLTALCKLLLYLAHTLGCASDDFINTVAGWINWLAHMINHLIASPREQAKNKMQTNWSQQSGFLNCHIWGLTGSICHLFPFSCSYLQLSLNCQ